ncbi:hypothetical protein Aab01nite_59980 [Paractinoplanes abujensis]|nr:hypothetical protein Aab01nite_59980 [Actinoplanes abujensis]
MRARRVRDPLPRPQRAGGGQARDDSGQCIVRNGEQKKVIGGSGHLVGGKNRGPRQQAGGPLPRSGRNSRGGHHAMPGGVQGGTQHSPDPPGADNAHSKTRRCAHIQIQSSKGVPVERKYAPPKHARDKAM